MDVSSEPLTLNQRVQGSSPCAPTKSPEQNQHLNATNLDAPSRESHRGNACGNKCKISVDDFARQVAVTRFPVS
jgi:hypothetical protein